MRIQAVVPESIVDGPGVRFVVFTQGCPHGCPACHSPQTHDPAGGYEATANDLVATLEENLEGNPLLAGVTLSGGEPFLHASELLPFAQAVHERNLNLWVYTGYTLEELLARGDEAELALLAEADTLVDGRFEIAQRTLEMPFVGSRNQRIIENPGKVTI